MNTLKPIHPYNLGDLTQRDSARNDFLQLGVTRPSIAIDVGGIGCLDTFDCSVVDFEGTNRLPKISEEQKELFLAIGSDAMDYLSAETLVYLDVRNWFTKDFIARKPRPRARHTFAPLDKAPFNGVHDSDLGAHNDTHDVEKIGVSYAMHLTTAGEGLLTTGCSVIDQAGVRSYEKGQVTHETYLRRGILNIFVRQGSVVSKGNEDIIIVPTTHNFTSNRGGRSYIETQFGIAEDNWPTE